MGNNQTQKAYEYEALMTLSGAGGTMDDTLRALQDDLKKLYDLVKECEELYHGKSNNSTIYKQYNQLYGNLGTASSDSGLWKQVYAAVQLQNAIYSNAKHDKLVDEQGMA